MDKKTIKSLEFNKILHTLATFASSEPARASIISLTPMKNVIDINSRLSEVEEADITLHQHSISPSFAFDDVSNILEKASVMSVLSMGEILKIARLLRVASLVKTNILKVPDPAIVLIKAHANSIYTDAKLEEDINNAIISDTEISDNASPELRNIRNKIKRTAENIKTKLHSFINLPAYSKYIQDSIITIRQDRYVIPLKVEYKGAIPGLVHDQSAPRQTLYVEPMVIIELNNTLKSYLMEEEHEIERILRDFTLRISGIVTPLFDTFERIVNLDIIFAKAKYASTINAIKPIINDNGYINIVQGRHPLLHPQKVVPTDIYLGKDFDMLLITGPNTGGKTVALKLVGLLQLMAMTGLYVPAKEAELSCFENIFCDIGDEQSIEQNLSTFSSHIANIVKIVDALNSKTLVLLDELGAGTDPTEGAALAISISSFIKESNAKAIITTHYNELKEYAVVTGRVENASMDFDSETYSPTYNLIIGTPGTSNAILIAKKLGLNPKIVAGAQGGIQEGRLEFENVLHSLERARRKAVENQRLATEKLQQADIILNNAQKERDRLFLQREKLNENVKKETRRLVEEAMQDANEIVDTLKNLIDEPTEHNLFEARKLRKSLTKYIINEENEFAGFGEEDDGDIRVGDNVFIKSLNVEGEVVAINPIKDSAQVKLGRMNSNFKIDEILKLKSEKKTIQKTTRHSTNKRELNNEQFSPEINLIGQDSMEAMFNLDNYIDSALVSGVNEIRIIHGHGAGILRNSVRRKLKQHSAIAEFRDGGYNEGGRGVTVATIGVKK